MQAPGGGLPGMPSSLLNGSVSQAQVAFHELHNGQAQQQQQQQQQRQPDPSSASQNYEHAAAAAHDDFFDEMLSGLPLVELSSKSPWDLASANGGGDAAAGTNGRPLFNIHPGGKAGMEDQATAPEGVHFAASPYDESILLASRLRQHQISGVGGEPPGLGKPAVPHQQQQHILINGMGRSAGDSGLVPLPLSLGSGDAAGSRLLLDRSRGDSNASFKSLASAVVGDGLFNRFDGSLQRGAPPPTGNQQNFHNPQPGAVTSQNAGAMGQAPAAGGAPPPRQRVRARRGQATDPHSIAERLRRERIADRMKALQELVPNANKTDKATMLDEIIDYVKFLQLQVKVLSMSRLGGAAAVVPLVVDMSQSEPSVGRGNAAGGDGLTATEHQVAKMMEGDIGTAMQYLQGKGLCLMPISLASAISTAAGHPRAGGLPNGAGVIDTINNNQINVNPLVAHAEAPSSPSMSVLTVQSATANGAGDSSVSKPC